MIRWPSTLTISRVFSTRAVTDPRTAGHAVQLHANMLSTERMIADLRAGKALKPGPQNYGRVSSEPEGGALTLTDPTLYDGSIIGKYKVQPPAAPEPPKPKPPGAA